MSLGGIVEDYLFQCSIERRLSANTVHAYRCDLRQFTDFLERGEKAQSVKTLKRYLAFMLEEAGLSIATARRRIACLQGFFKFADENGVMENPFRNWSPSLKLPRRLPRAVPCTDIRTLIHSSNDETDIEADTVFAVLVFSATGIRVSELCAVRAIDVSTDGSAVQVFGKGSRDRIVYVSDQNLRRCLAERRSQRMDQNGECAPLLTNSRGAPLQPQALRGRLRRLCKRRGLSQVITPHMLRHTAATLLIEKGIDIRLVQRLLGHSSISTTEIYTQVNDMSLKRAVFDANTLQLIADAPAHVAG